MFLDPQLFQISGHRQEVAATVKPQVKALCFDTSQFLSKLVTLKQGLTEGHCV